MNAFKLLLLVGLAAALAFGWLLTQGPESPEGRVDDWAYDVDVEMEEGLAGGQTMYSASAAAPARATGTVGLAAGGAKDVGNFRENIANGYLPLPTDLTYEGLFYDYYFDTGLSEACTHLFCPSYAAAVARDPFSDRLETYLAVGLNSGLRESDFARKTLNLVIVLDISGSMSSPFDRYYYDRFGNRHEVENGDGGASKLRVAARAVVALMDHLRPDDRLGIVLFDDGAYLAKPLAPVGGTDMESIKGHVLELEPRGGTNMSAGFKRGSALFEELGSVNPETHENRIIFLTDAMPNLGETSEEGLFGMAERNARTRVFSTFIGVGVDFNTELVEAVTKIRGANYYSVHSAQQFEERMDEGFDYMVTPLVFDLALSLEADGYEIAQVYGSPEADEATGVLMRVNTLFPSKTEGGQTRGGLVLLKLRKTGEASDGALKLTVSYEDRNGRPGLSESRVALPGDETERFANGGVRKGVLLTRYADLIKHWIIDEARSRATDAPVQPAVSASTGLTVPVVPPELGQWERQSVPLHVSEEYRALFASFASYFSAEMEALGDADLNKELALLNALAGGE